MNEGLTSHNSNQSIPGSEIYIYHLFDAKVYRDEKLVLFAKKSGYFKTIYSFYKGEDMVFKSSIKALFFGRVRLSIMYQNLEDSLSVRPDGKVLSFGDHKLTMRHNIFEHPLYAIYMDGNLVASVTAAVTIATESKFEIDFVIDDEKIKLYCLLYFIMRLIPV